MSAPAPAPEISRFLGRLATERAYSPRTLSSYRADLQVLADWVGQAGARGSANDLARDPVRAPENGQAAAAGGVATAPDWSTLDEAVLRRWIASAVRAGQSPRSIARRLSCWRGFIDDLVLAGRLPANPARGLRAPRAARRLPKALTPDQAGAVMTAPGEAFEQVRDRALLELLYSCGLRLSELTSLDVAYVKDAGHESTSWLVLDEAEVNVFGKGGKRRTVPVGRQAMAALRDWLDLRARWLAGHADADAHALFLSVRGARLASRSVQHRLRPLGLAQGLASRLHPHVLRHSFASHVLQSSGDLRAVQELLGHASIRSTQVYTALDFQRLAGVYDAAHPRARRRGHSG